MEKSTDVKGLEELVCLRFSCSHLLHCCSCFLLSVSFTLFSWGVREVRLWLEFELQVVKYSGIWDDRIRRNMWEPELFSDLLGFLSNRRLSCFPSPHSQHAHSLPVRFLLHILQEARVL